LGDENAERNANALMLSLKHRARVLKSDLTYLAQFLLNWTQYAVVSNIVFESADSLSHLEVFSG
jgi:hypothetical protein